MDDRELVIFRINETDFIIVYGSSDLANDIEVLLTESEDNPQGVGGEAFHDPGTEAEGGNWRL